MFDDLLSGERSLPFGLLVSMFSVNPDMQNLPTYPEKNKAKIKEKNIYILN